MTGANTLLFLKVLCDIELKKREIIRNESKEESRSTPEKSSTWYQSPLKIYMQEEHGVGGPLRSKRYACHKCSCLFTRKRHLRKHLDVHCSHKCLGCSECVAEVNKTYHSLQGGLQAAYRSFPCSSCTSRFHTRAGLAVHEEVHPEPGRMLQCGSCPQQFSNRLDLDNHHKMHVTSKVYKCINCPKAFTTPSNLAKHRQVRHEEKQEIFGDHFLASLEASPSEEHDLSLKFACEICEVVCSNDRELDDHVESHLSERGIRCLECGKLFITRGALRRHMQVHRLRRQQKVSRKRKLNETQKTNSSPTNQQDTGYPKCLNGEACEEHPGVSLEKNCGKTCSLCHGTFRAKYYNTIHVCQAFPPIEDLNEKDLEENNFSCPACAKQYSCILPLKLHCDVHLGSDPQLCRMCDRRLFSVQKLDYHYESHAKNTCMKCSVYFNTKLELFLHDCDVIRKEYTCTVCEVAFTCKKSLQKHWRIHPPPKIRNFQCDECKQRFLKESNFRAHRMKHTGQYPFVCTVCNDKFITYSTFRRHSIMHVRDKSNTCEICGQVCWTKLGLDVHMQIHQPKTEDARIEAENSNKATKHRPHYKPLKPQVCNLCGSVFRYQQRLISHMKQVHKQNIPYPFTCEVCSKGFILEHNYIQHVESSLKLGTCKVEPPPEIGPFSCSECGKEYLYKSKLNAHMFKHLDDSECPHQCSLCGRGFALETYLKTHEKICSGPNGFKCKICGKTLKRKASLDSHLKGHATELTCNVCGEKFLFKRNLTKHTKFCTPESFNTRLVQKSEIVKGKKRPCKFTCAKCDRMFYIESRYIVHLESHEGKVPFECKPCGQKFLSKSNLTRHKCKVGSAIVKVETQP